MSIVRVWTSEGKWSDAVCGLDKVHLMKRAIRTASIVCDSHGEYLDDPFVGYEIDGQTFYDCGLYDENDKYRESINWRGLRNNGGIIDFNSVRMFQMPAGDLNYLAEEEEVLAPAYNKLVDLANTTSSDKNYCILLKFVEE